MKKCIHAQTFPTDANASISKRSTAMALSVATCFGTLFFALTFSVSASSRTPSLSETESKNPSPNIEIASVLSAQNLLVKQRPYAHHPNQRLQSLQVARRARALNTLGSTPAPYLTKVFTNNSTCSKNASCDLKSFKIEVYKSSTEKGQLDTSVNDLIWSDMMVGSYETTSLASLEEFAVVQFIRGCDYMNVKISGKPVTMIGTYRSFFDYDTPFIHPDWTPDSVDSDPLYGSVPYDPSLFGSIPRADWKRHAAYRIHKPNPFVDESTSDQQVYQYQTPSSPILYFSDYPSPSYAPADRKDPNVSTSSLNFKTCIFKTSDIPTKADPSWTGNGKEIACFEWHNAHKYDAKKDRFVDASIDPLCLDHQWAEKVFLENATPPSLAPLDWTKTAFDYRIPSSSCDALLGKKVNASTYFAGELCRADLDHSRNYNYFSQIVNSGDREIPSTFLVRRLDKNGQASIDFSELRSGNLSEMGAIFSEMKTHAIEAYSKRIVGQSDLDQAILGRLQNLSAKLLNQGAGCNGGYELYAGYDPVINQVQICPAWTHLPTEAWVEMFANQIAATLDVCSFKPIYSMTPDFFADEKKQNPVMVRQCFKNDPDLGNATIIGLVNSTLEPLADAGITDFETIQVDLDAALLKCGLITARPMPTQFQNFVSEEMWTCGRRAAGDISTNPVPQPWRNQKACGGRVRDVIQGTYAADLMAYYLRRHRDVIKADSSTALLYSARYNSCAQQSLSGLRGLDSQEKLGLYLAKPEILNGLGCQVSSSPKLCETNLFTSP